VFRFLAIIGVLYLLYSVALPSKLPEIVYDGELYVGDEFSFTPSRPKSENFVVFMNKDQGRGVFNSFMFNAGIRSQIGLLSEEKYAEFQRIKSSGACPASFLNKNAKMILAIPESEEVMRGLKNLQEGDEVRLTSMSLKNPQREVDGHTMPVQISGAEIRLVQAIE